LGQGQHLLWWRILLCKIQPQIPPKKRVVPARAWRKEGVGGSKGDYSFFSLFGPAGRVCQACKIRFFTKNKTVPLDNLVVSASYVRFGLSRLNSFAINENLKAILTDKKILLIDDIATTGSTLFECARVLKLAGAQKVFGAVIARQEINT
jgi:hypothetical protein